MPFAWVSFLDDQREWIKAGAGIEPGEVPFAQSLAAMVVRTDGVVLCPDATSDLRFARHPWVTGDPKLRFLAMVPLHGDQGLPVGVLSIGDTASHPVDTLIDVLPALARQAESLLELRRLRMQRDVLASHVVHDLKNPLAALSLNAEFCLREVPETSPTWETLRDITQITHVVDRLVRDIGDVTREGRTISVRPHAVDPAELCLKLQQKSQPGLDRAGGQLELQVDPALGPVELDERLFERVFLNLIEFATTRTGAKQSVLSMRAVGDEIEARVSDGGPSVDGETLQRLFHPRLGVAGDALANVSGRRFGFAFCRMAVEAQRGRIWAEENETRGISCCIRLPLRRPAEIVPLSSVPNVSQPWFEQLGRLTPWAGLTPQPQWQPKTQPGSA
jgi:signal transduction histidine kinase